MSEPEERPLQIHAELSRDLGLSSALAIGVGTMIAAGIFTLSGLAIRNVGSAAIVAFLLAAVVATFTALSYIEFVALYPESGEGYLYARKTFSPPLAYLVGWALFLGYTSSCAFYLASFSVFFNEFIWHAPIQTLTGIIALVALTLLNMKGTKESGGFQIVVTIAKVLLLIWFIWGGLQVVDVSVLQEKFSTDVLQIGSTAALVFITFFGFSAIAASAGEVKDPGKTIPRAIFIAMAVVTVLYTLVVVVVAAANLTEYTEASMGVAAERFLGPIGGMVIVAGGLFSMISASNASIMAGSRVALSMSRLRHFPAMFGTINPRTQTPVRAVVLVGTAIFILAVSLPLEGLAHFADTVLLLALIFVNAALIVHRRKFPDMVRPIRIPFVPLLPALGILANLYLLSQALHHIVPVMLAVGSLVVGMGAFLAWKALQPDEAALPGEPSRVALERSAPTEGRFRVLVPVANPDNVDQLIGIASALVGPHEGEIVALRVVLVPYQLAPTRDRAYVERERHILERANRAAQSHDTAVTSVVRVGHDAARAILETASDEQCDAILLGWKGYTSTARKILGEVVDSVVSHAKRDILLVKLVGDELPKNYLLPTAGGPHAKKAEEYAATLVKAVDGKLTLCGIVRPSAGADVVASEEERLRQTVERIAEFNGVQAESKVIRHRSVSVGIIREADDHDAVVVGAAGRSMYPQILFGGIPESVAKLSGKSVIVVKQHQPVKALIKRVLGD